MSYNTALTAGAETVVLRVHNSLIDNTDQNAPANMGRREGVYSSAWNTRSATHEHLSKVSSVTVTL
jgi:hypothetical protein